MYNKRDEERDIGTELTSLKVWLNYQFGWKVNWMFWKIGANLCDGVWSEGGGLLGSDAFLLDTLCLFGNITEL